MTLLYTVRHRVKDCLKNYCLFKLNKIQCNTFPESFLQCVQFLPFASFSLNIYSIHGCIVLCLLYFFIVTVNAKDMIGNLYFLLTSTRQKIIYLLWGFFHEFIIIFHFCAVWPCIHLGKRLLLAYRSCFPKNTVLKHGWK